MQGIKNALAMTSVGIGMIKARRLSPFELFKPHGCKDRKGIHAMLKKAYEIENQRKQLKVS